MGWPPGATPLQPWYSSSIITRSDNYPDTWGLLNLKYCLNNQTENFEQAITYANQLYTFHKRAHDKKGMSDSLEKLGSSYYNLSDTHQAKKYAQRALNLAYEVGDQLIQKKCQQLLLDIDRVSKSL